MRPVLGLDRKRIGSKNSRVGPEVTTSVRRIPRRPCAPVSDYPPHVFGRTPQNGALAFYYDWTLNQYWILIQVA